MFNDKKKKNFRDKKYDRSYLKDPRPLQRNDMGIDNDRRDKHKNNKQSKNNEKHQSKNPVVKIIDKSIYYNRDTIYHALVKGGGLKMMLKDISKDNKNCDNNRKYVKRVLCDINVVAALPKAMDSVLKDKSVKKKDFKPLIDEILYVVRTSYRDSMLEDKYGRESVEAIRKTYMHIANKFNKKLSKRLRELDIDDNIINNIITMTGGYPSTTIYQFLQYLYKHADELDMTEKKFYKLLKTCYGKENINECIKCIMKEKVNNNKFNNYQNDGSTPQMDMWMIVDNTMRDVLENMSRKDMRWTITQYIKERAIAFNKYSDRSKSRFGDWRSISTEDYPNLTTMLTQMEEDDISIRQYLR